MWRENTMSAKSDTQAVPFFARFLENQSPDPKDKDKDKQPPSPSPLPYTYKFPSDWEDQ